MSFAGKVILITGASNGIGAAAAEYFAEEGALLALVARNAERFEKVLANMKGKGIEMEPLVILADVAIDAERIINETIDKYGRLDVLINNAAFGNHESLETLNIENFDTMMATNVRSVIQLTKLAIFPHLIESKGNVVNISSIAGIASFQNFLIYSMTKAALDQFTKCVAMEVAKKGVRCNSVNPGFIDTDFHGFERNSEEYASLMQANIEMHPIGRVGQSEDIVDAIAFLASEKASFVTGHLFVVDGGLGRKGAF
ncbi:uncharacterized protein LOC116343033 [Contarinia nasturtii]|uniref:uncharacterized protein LOC116343033 n=1 Tax=Contarinia nasturtii TaxID=265458 RepID=UPI0012D49C06|nr:uncharacterized protein LOC116343033 [Contarinia nasturtii]